MCYVFDWFVVFVLVELLIYWVVLEEFYCELVLFIVGVWVSDSLTVVLGKEGTVLLLVLLTVVFVEFWSPV